MTFHDNCFNFCLVTTNKDKIIIKSCIGEAVYVDDIPSPPNCLHGAFLFSSKPLARVRSIKLGPEQQLDGERDVVSSKDIPNGGENIGSKTIFGIEPLFAEEIARCVGDRLAFVVSS